MAINVARYSVQLVKDKGIRYEGSEISATSPRQIYHLAETIFSLSSQAEEVFCIICFNTKMKVAGAFEVSRGTVDSSLVAPREVFKRALLCNASCMVLLHNHPSGELYPSPEDKKVTERLVKAGEILNVRVIDHLIVGSERFISLKEEDYM